MSEGLDSATQRQRVLKALILRLRQGEETEAVKAAIREQLAQVSYDEVVAIK